MLFAALVAVTEQLPALPVAVSVVPLILQVTPLDPVAAKVTDPVPVPPVVLSVLPDPALAIVIGVAFTVSKA